jgi:hypothetical protein
MQILTKPLKKSKEVSQLMPLVSSMKLKIDITDMLIVQVMQIMLKI